MNERAAIAEMIRWQKGLHNEGTIRSVDTRQELRGVWSGRVVWEYQRGTETIEITAQHAGDPTHIEVKITNPGEVSTFSFLLNLPYRVPLGVVLSRVHAAMGNA